METLRRFEEEQRMLQLIQSCDITASFVGDEIDQDSGRFLAQFAIFMTMPCGGLGLVKKFHLISVHMEKLSAMFLEEASVSLHGEGYERIAVTPHCEMNNSPFQSNSECVALVSLDAMERANSTLDDFCRTYFSFHDMDANMLESTFRYLPILSFTESYIYQLDTLNEKRLPFAPTRRIQTLGGIHEKINERWIINSMDGHRTNPLKPLVLLLDRRGLLTPRIESELASGEEYWALERKLCQALVNKEEILIDDVMMAIHQKSFDYRVLNLLLYQLRRANVNELHMEFLSVSEFLVEVSDDLFDYEEDVLENNFNILRMFVRIYGPSRAPSMLAKCITEGEEKYENLSKALDPELLSKYIKRCKEGTREGGKTCGHPLGTWAIPRVISNEELYHSHSTSLDSK